MRDKEKRKGARRVQAAEATDARSPEPVQHESATTAYPAVRALEGGPPIAEELTGRASTTSESLTELFQSRTAEHLADGFRGGSGDDPDTDIVRDDDQGRLMQTDSVDRVDNDEGSDGAEEKS